MESEARKRCSKCDEHKPSTGFYRCARRPDGLQVWCKQCSLASVKKYQHKHGRSIIHRSVKYGLNPDEVQVMLQIPVCQSCRAPFSDSFSQKFDHCHQVGHFRGVLCQPCNSRCQGDAPDAIRGMLACIAYLRRDLERASEPV